MTALHNLARELDHTDKLVDYRRRRHTLQDWILAPEAWAEIVDGLPPTRGHIQPVLDDLKRQVASVYVWTRVTDGECHFAPQPLTSRQPEETRTLWKQRFRGAWFEMVQPHPLKHYAELRMLLDPLARDLASKIDDESGYASKC